MKYLRSFSNIKQNNEKVNRHGTKNDESKLQENKNHVKYGVKFKQFYKTKSAMG